MPRFTATDPRGACRRHAHELRRIGSRAQARAGQRTTITYHPNGALKGFTYGNGITHLTTQNARSLPEASTDTRTGTIVTGSAVAYDGNGNPEFWVDSTPAPDDRANRSMVYDDLDRLSDVNAPGLWGQAHYHYDGAGNFTSTEVGTAARTYQLDASHNRIESRDKGDGGIIRLSSKAQSRKLGRSKAQSRRKPCS